MQNSRTENHSNRQLQAPTAPDSSGRHDPPEGLTIIDLLELIDTAVEHAVRRTLGPLLSIEEPPSAQLCADVDDTAILRALPSRKAPAASEPPSSQINHKGIPGECNSVFSVAEAADLLGIPQSFTYELIASHDIPSIRLGRRVVVPAKPSRTSWNQPPPPTPDTPESTASEQRWAVTTSPAIQRRARSGTRGSWSRRTGHHQQ
jgi:excisionase family DNA binding protein